MAMMRTVFALGSGSVCIANVARTLSRNHFLGKLLSTKEHEYSFMKLRRKQRFLPLETARRADLRLCLPRRESSRRLSVKPLKADGQAPARLAARQTHVSAPRSQSKLTRYLPLSSLAYAKIFRTTLPPTSVS